MKNKLLVLSIVIASTVLTASCGGNSNPSLGDKISSEGNAVADIGKSWQKGDDMVRKGERLKLKGKRDIEKGDEMIKKGRSMKQSAEKSYKGKS